MQSLSQTFSGVKLAAPAPRRAAPRAAAVVVSASADVRRSALALAAAAVLSLSSVGSALAEEDATLPRLQDDTKKNAGVQLIYEARDLDNDAKPRSGAATRFAFQKLAVAETQARAGESLARLESNVAPYVAKKYWTQASNELRRQIGTLRFDLENLVQAKGSGREEVDALVAAIEKLDFAIRKKNPDNALAGLDAVAATAAAVKVALL